MIDNWQRSWRLLSVQLAALAVGFGSLPAEMQGAILSLLNVPQERVPAVLGALFIVLRMVKQVK